MTRRYFIQITRRASTLSGETYLRSHYSFGNVGDTTMYQYRAKSYKDKKYAQLRLEKDKEFHRNSWFRVESITLEKDIGQGELV